MDGYAVAKALRREAGLRDTFLIALTGYALPEDQRRAAEAGFDAHLTKPVTVERVEEVMGRARAIESARPGSTTGGPAGALTRGVGLRDSDFAAPPDLALAPTSTRRLDGRLPNAADDTGLGSEGVRRMLTGFLVQNFDELVSRTRANASARRHSEPAPQLEERIPLLLARLRDAAGGDLGTVPHACGESGCSSAARHAGALLEKGWPVSQVVHDCAAVRQAITRLAIEKSAAISLEELEAVSRWLDTAIAETVAEYAHLKEEATCHREVERLGQVSHDLRTQLQTALLSFRALKKGTAAHRRERG